MARRVRRIIGGRSQMVRETLWISIATSFTGLAAGGATLFSGFTATQLALRPFTIVRTRGMLQVMSDQFGASETYGASFGICVVSDQAAAIGVTAVPTPVTDRASDLWFVYETILGRLIFASSTGLHEFGHLRSWDSKAMRKVEEGQDVAIVVEAETTSQGVDIHKSGRMLIKLH